MRHASCVMPETLTAQACLSIVSMQGGPLERLRGQQVPHSPGIVSLMSLGYPGLPFKNPRSVNRADLNSTDNSCASCNVQLCTLAPRLVRFTLVIQARYKLRLSAAWCCRSHQAARARSSTDASALPLGQATVAKSDPSGRPCLLNSADYRDK